VDGTGAGASPRDAVRHVIRARMAVTSLPIDVLIAILAFLAVPDLANLARSGRFFRDFVSHACESFRRAFESSPCARWIITAGPVTCRRIPVRPIALRKRGPHAPLELLHTTMRGPILRGRAESLLPGLFLIHGTRRCCQF